MEVANSALEDHNMIQAASRVNRAFRDKPTGPIVDDIGIGDQLREATPQYAQGGGRDEITPGIAEAAIPLFRDKLAVIRATLPRPRRWCVAAGAARGTAKARPYRPH
jgi:type I restriction enzyme R subunit